MSKLIYYPVNWVDGMKINKNHFIETENAIFNKLYNTMGANLNHLKYGLLPTESNKSGSIDFSVDVDDQRNLKFRLTRCYAISKGGIVVDVDSFDDKSNTSKVFSFEESINLSKLESGVYYLLLTINPYIRIPIGIANAEENPPRNPFVRPKYSIGVVNHANIDVSDLGGEFIPIGKLEISADGVQILKNYIPPCTSISSHHQLIAFHNRLSEFLSKIESDIITIIGKIHRKQQQSTLSGSVHAVSRNLLDFISNNMVIHQWFNLFRPPADMLIMVVQFSRVMRNSIEILSHQSKEELINYYTDWCNLRTGEFESLLLQTINVKYNHEDINNTLEEVSQLLEVIVNLFTTLSGLDYIGKRKQAGIFVKEEQAKKYEDDYIQNVEVPKAPRTSFLADD